MLQRRNQTISKEVSKLRKDIDDKKSVQFTGQSNIVVYSIQNPGTWDIDFVTTSLHRVEIEFTSTNMVGSFTSIEATVLVNGVEYNNSYTTYDISTVEWAVRPSDTKTFLWFSIINVPPGTDIKMKFGIKSIDTGNLTVTRVL